MHTLAVVAAIEMLGGKIDGAGKIRGETAEKRLDPLTPTLSSGGRGGFLCSLSPPGRGRG